MSSISEAGRLAGEGEGITAEELALAARNHGMPLEAMRYELTPPGLHYLLTHYDIPLIDAGQWTLDIAGRARLSLDQLKERAHETVRVTLECAGNGRAWLDPRPVSQPWLVEAVGTAEWTGVPLADILTEFPPDEHTREVVFTGADHGIERGVEQDYQRSLTLQEARRPEVLLAYEMNGAPLPPQHGYPLRLIAPGWYGMAHVKWLRRIDFSPTPFTGYQQSVAYRFRREADEEGEPVTRIRPRALLVPPGFPDFMSRKRVVPAGERVLEGRAWSGQAPVTRVEVSTDGGSSWEEAVLDPDAGHRWAWRRFTFAWRAAPGHYELTARAFDADGNAQPVEQEWNRGGFGNNSAQLITVWCR